MKENQIFPASASASTALQFQTNPPHRILVVDDDPYICHLSADVLIRHGYEVNAVADGAAGWEELQAYNYNLLITEHKLPRLTGVELIKKLRAAHMALPVVMAAGRLPTRELSRNPSLQLAATLVKPFGFAALLNTVKNILHSIDHTRRQIVPLTNWRSQPSPAGFPL